jgi:CheY-like chemotaxis protein
VALKVLLADDSVPAQNMGKKILTDAGYDVLTVSNGLEALRKIADLIPDVAILDIFMPGYTGLEVCERLRASAATAELPVILTVGKLEPYRPEDGEHVRSNAVIVKPFAAAELISAVRSLIGVRHEEVLRATETENRPATPVAELPAIQEPLESVPPAEAPDEPLFSGVDSAAATNAGAVPPQFPAESAHSAEPLQSDEEPLGAESLAFNPSAVHTPFSASVMEPSPTDAHLAAEAGPFAFTEFDLAPESSYSAEPSPEEPALESWQPEQEATAHHEAAADAEVETAGSEPLAEGREGAPSSGVAASFVAPDEAPESIIREGVVSNEEAALAATTAHLAQNDEARRMAFEDLYNSNMPFPLEGDAAPFPGPVLATEPVPADTSKHQAYEIEPDSEIVMDDCSNPFLAPERMEQSQPGRALEPIFEDELLLEEKSPANWASAGSVPQPTEAFAPALGELDPPLLDPASDSTPDFHAESPAERPEIPCVATVAESEPMEASPERSHLVAEVAKVEALLVQMQAVRHGADEETELAHAGTEFQQFEPAVDSPPPDSSASEPESAPLQAQEATQNEVVTGAAQIETELYGAKSHGAKSEVAPLRIEPEAEPEQVCLPQEMAREELAPSGAEAWVDETASNSAQRSSEAERIHQAVEKVFDRFRPLLVAAIVREMARLD